MTNINGDKALSDITETGFSVAGPKALKQAGLTPKDIQLFTPYDDFLIAILIQLEQIGFCGRGEGSEFIHRTHMTYKGKLHLNTIDRAILHRQSRQPTLSLPPYTI